MQDKLKSFPLRDTLSIKERNILNLIPKLYEQDGRGKNAIVYAHYFLGGYDFWATECSPEGDDIIMFGLTKLLDIELGYTSLRELKSVRAQGVFTVDFDRYWSPCRLADIDDEEAAAYINRIFASDPDEQYPIIPIPDDDVEEVESTEVLPDPTVPATQPSATTSPASISSGCVTPAAPLSPRDLSIFSH